MPSMFVDSHCHLDHERFDADRDAVIERAFAAGLTDLITIGTDLESSENAISIAARHPHIHATVGVHPHDARAAPAGYLDRLRALSQRDRVVAVGEIGLDYHYDRSPRDVQRRLFAEQIGLARELALPIVIHMREAELDCLDLLRGEGQGDLRGVVHCFTSTLDFAHRCLDLGLSISIPGVVTYQKPGELIEVVRRLPLDSMLVETDAPYLAPAPHRGQRNEPAFVAQTVEKIAALTGNSVEDVRRTTGRAAARLFGLALPEGEQAARIAYVIRDNLYLNITNSCTLACTFCVKRHDRYVVKGHPLKLDRPPTLEEIQAACGDLAPYREVVFVGLGEPTLRLDLLKQVARWLKQRGKRVRLDTDGLGSLVNGRPVAGELVGLIDAVSVSLNAPDAETYARICPSRFGAAAYDAVKRFIAEVRDSGIETTATVVGLPEFDVAAIERCRAIAESELKVRFRLRTYDNVG
ncbi:MAG: YchF/TatD family DNA exonuclease [Deltaproteobacteria bacterium]|nr:YchF/TatD family DNA exonuclease [Deltaproteobacteria bacterium]